MPQKWIDQQKTIRDAIAVLYPDMPLASDKLIKFRKKKEKHEDLHYFDCKYIMECLKQTDEYSTTNFFGQVCEKTAFGDMWAWRLEGVAC